MKKNQKLKPYWICIHAVCENILSQMEKQMYATKHTMSQFMLNL